MAQSRYGMQVELTLPYEEAVARTKAALRTEGFGALTEIDVRRTLREKLGAEFEPYLILGAGTPPLAHRALEAEHDVGLLLPCNVIVHQHGDRAMVAAADPEAMLGLVGNPAIGEVAREAKLRLERALAALATT